jgi:hypothetical protein
MSQVVAADALRDQTKAGHEDHDTTTGRDIGSISAWNFQKQPLD